jgi:hypothetical protein
VPAVRLDPFRRIVAVHWADSFPFVTFSWLFVLGGSSIGRDIGTPAALTAPIGAPTTVAIDDTGETTILVNCASFGAVRPSQVHSLIFALGYKDDIIEFNWRGPAGGNAFGFGPPPGFVVPTHPPNPNPNDQTGYAISGEGLDASAGTYTFKMDKIGLISLKRNGVDAKHSDGSLVVTPRPPPPKP